MNDRLLLFRHSAESSIAGKERLATLTVVRDRSDVVILTPETGGHRWCLSSR